MFVVVDSRDRLVGIVARASVAEQMCENKSYRYSHIEKSDSEAVIKKFLSDWNEQEEVAMRPVPSDLLVRFFRSAPSRLQETFGEIQKKRDELEFPEKNLVFLIFGIPGTPSYESIGGQKAVNAFSEKDFWAEFDALHDWYGEDYKVGMVFCDAKSPADGNANIVGQGKDGETKSMSVANVMGVGEEYWKAFCGIPPQSDNLELLKERMVLTTQNGIVPLNDCSIQELQTLLLNNDCHPRVNKVLLSILQDEWQGNGGNE